MPSRAPAPSPCASCPYRKDAPSGLWDGSEYDKLPAYDLDTPEQPPAAFFCHQQDGRLCAGWCGTHDMDNSLGLRLAVAMGVLTEEAADAARSYRSPVELWESGQAAAEHGRRDLAAPDDRAVAMMTKLDRLR